MYVAVSFFLCTRTARMAHGRYDILEDTIEAMWMRCDMAMEEGRKGGVSLGLELWIRERAEMRC